MFSTGVRDSDINITCNIRLLHAGLPYWSVCGCYSPYKIGNKAMYIYHVS